MPKSLLTASLPSPLSRSRLGGGWLLRDWVCLTGHAANHPIVPDYRPEASPRPMVLKLPDAAQRAFNACRMRSLVSGHLHGTLERPTMPALTAGCEAADSKIPACRAGIGAGSRTEAGMIAADSAMIIGRKPQRRLTEAPAGRLVAGLGSCWGDRDNPRASRELRQRLIHRLCRP